MNQLVNEAGESPQRSDIDISAIFDSISDPNRDIYRNLDPHGVFYCSSSSSTSSSSSPYCSTSSSDSEDHREDETATETTYDRELAPKMDGGPSNSKNSRSIKQNLQFGVDVSSANRIRGKPGVYHRRSTSESTSHSNVPHTNVLSKRFSMQPHPLSPTRPHLSTVNDGSTAANPKETQGMVGEEPGIDVDIMYVDLPDSQGSQVTLIDYSPNDCKIAHYDVEKDGGCMITGSNEVHMLRHHIRDALDSRPSWSKVRWVVVNGLSWEAIQPIAMKYGLHPLAVEDLLDVPQRTKMEVFPGQLFCCFPLHVLSTTPTPYSFLHMCLRQVLLSVVMFFSCVSLGAKRIWTMSSGVIDRRLRSSKSPDPENHPGTYFASQTSSRLPGKETPKKDIRGYKNHYPVSTVSTSSEESLASKMPYRVSKNSFNWDSDNESTIVDFSSSFSASSRTDSDAATLCAQSMDEPIEECVPFYTVNYGMFCGDAESSPVANRIRNIPSRSIYEWNQGNLALKREAAQNLHISGSSNSIEIALEQVSLFLVGDTVISIFEKSAPKIYRPLENRLKSPDTLLRNSSDPAILVQALLDASVDLIGPILNEYRSRLSNLQVQGVKQPNLQHTRALHAFITDLTVLRPPLRSLVSIVEHIWTNSAFTKGSKSILSEDEFEHAKTAAADSSLNDEDAEFCANCSTSDYLSGGTKSKSRRPRGHGKSSDGRYSRRAVSDAAAFYFRDVADHALRYLQDLDDMRNQSKTLSSLIFNTISIRASDSVKMLSLVSVVFLPLTFLTGYFGMNFKGFAILDHDVGYYWIIATPAAAALTVFVMYPSMVSIIQEVWTWIREQV